MNNSAFNEIEKENRRLEKLHIAMEQQRKKEKELRLQQVKKGLWIMTSKKNCNEAYLAKVRQKYGIE